MTNDCSHDSENIELVVSTFIHTISRSEKEFECLRRSPSLHHLHQRLLLAGLLTGMLRGPTLLLGDVADVALLDPAVLPPRYSIGESANCCKILVFSPD